MHFKDFFKNHDNTIEVTSAAEFTKKFFIFFAIQIATIAALFLVYRWAGQHHLRDVQYGVFAVTLLAEIFLVRIYQKNIDYRGRLMDLYPDSPLPSRKHVGLVTWTPFLFFPVMIHMMTAQKKPNESMPWIYQNKLSPLVLMFAAHLSVFALAAFRLPKAALIVSPSMSYTANISSSITKSMESSQQMKKSVAQGNKPAFDAYYMNGDLNPTKMVLGLTTYFGSLEKYSPRVPASEQQNYKTESFQNLISYYSQWTPQKSTLSNISFISLLTPTALVEASLLALVDMTVSDISMQRVTQATDDYMTKQGAEPQLMRAFHDLPMYKSAVASQQSRFLKLFNKFNP